MVLDTLLTSRQPYFCKKMSAAFLKNVAFFCYCFTCIYKYICNIYAVQMDNNCVYINTLIAMDQALSASFSLPLNLDLTHIRYFSVLEELSVM